MVAASALAAALAEGLRAAGVQRIFGMPGGGPNLDMIGAAHEVGIPFVLTHGETAACIMAGTFGRVTGTPGVALVTRGPGTTSAANGLAQATLDRFPLLVIGDTVSEADAERVAHQRIDQVAMARPLTKWSGTLGTSDPAAVAAAAARLACVPPAGGVYLSFDPRVLGDAVPPAPPVTAADPMDWERARPLLAAARHPLVIVGLDAVDDATAVRTALKTLDCPVLVTYEAKGVIPESWPTYAGLFTGATIESDLLEQADLILGIGVDTVEPIPGPWPYTAAVILLHRQPGETAYFGSPLALVGSYSRDLPTLVRALRSEWPSGSGAATRRHHAERLDFTTDGLGPHEVVRTTREVLGPALCTVDAGAHMLVAMELWETEEAGSTLISNGLATMGFALPAAVGMSLARPGRRVVCFVGDGGLGVALAELETIARLDLDVTVVVFNDAALTLIELKQAEAAGENAVRFGRTDFAALSNAMGIPGRTADDGTSLAAALAGPRRGPWLVDAHIDPAAYRHVLRAIRG